MKEFDFFSELSPEERLEDRLMAEISTAIIKKRTASGLTQEEFARSLGVSQSMISKYESGSYNFSIATLIPILNALHMRLSIVDQNTPAHSSPSRSSSSSSFFGSVSSGNHYTPAAAD